MIVPLLFLAVAAGAALQSATGFGFSLLSAPILFAVVDPQPAIGLLALLGMEVNLLTLLTEGRRPRPLTREATILVSCALPGALLGALDTVAFEARCESAWWPALRARYPLQLDGTRLDDLLVHLLHHRTRTSSWILDEYPSHLHIDLLPQVQSGGWGRRLLGTLFDALRADGSAGVHWGVSTRNEPAIGFYRHLGCTELSADPMLVTFGSSFLCARSTAPRG